MRRLSALVAAGAAVLGLTFVVLQAQQAERTEHSDPRPEPPTPSAAAELDAPDGLAHASSGAAALRFGDVRLPTGVRLHYAEQGDPAGPPVILLHGGSDSWFSFSRALPHLSGAYHVYALSQRGHGDSDRPADGYAMTDLAADVIAFMDAKGLRRATVVGHSMGSFVAQQVALAAPERVARLVLVNSTTTPRKIVGIDELKAAVDSFTDPVPVEFIREFQNGSVYRPVPPAFMDRVVAESQKLPAYVWKGFVAGLIAMDPATGLAEHRIPTLLMWGDRDAMFPRSEQEALLAMIPGSTLKTYRDVGHTPQWERPEEFVRDLEAFIARTPPR